MNRVQTESPQDAPKNQKIKENQIGINYESSIESNIHLQGHYSKELKNRKMVFKSKYLLQEKKKNWQIYAITTANS